MDNKNAVPLFHPVRFSHPPKVNAAVFNSFLRAIGRPIMVIKARMTLRTTLAVPSLAKTLVKYAQ